MRFFIGFGGGEESERALFLVVTTLSRYLIQSSSSFSVASYTSLVLGLGFEEAKADSKTLWMGRFSPLAG